MDTSLRHQHLIFPALPPVWGASVGSKNEEKKIKEKLCVCARIEHMDN